MMASEWSAGVVDSCWSATGSELLVQSTEAIRCFTVGEALVESGAMTIEPENVFGIGHSAGDWWIVRREGHGVGVQRGLEGKVILLAELGDGKIKKAKLSPDGAMIACALDGALVALWSAKDGNRHFSLRFQDDEVAKSLFAPMTIEEFTWSSDSRLLSIRPGVPLDELMVIDVHARRIVGQIF